MGRLQHVGPFIETRVIRNNSIDTGNIDDRAFPLPHHIRDERLADGEQSNHVALSAIHPVLGTLCFKASAHASQSAVDEDIKSTESLDNLSMEAIDGIDHGNV